MTTFNHESELPVITYERVKPNEPIFNLKLKLCGREYRRSDVTLMEFNEFITRLNEEVKQCQLNNISDSFFSGTPESQLEVLTKSLLVIPEALYSKASMDFFGFI